MADLKRKQGRSENKVNKQRGREQTREQKQE